MDKWEVIYYVSSSGSSPVKEFLDANLNVKIKALRFAFSLNLRS